MDRKMGKQLKFLKTCKSSQQFRDPKGLSECCVHMLIHTFMYSMTATVGLKHMEKCFVWVCVSEARF